SRVRRIGLYYRWILPGSGKSSVCLLRGSARVGWRLCAVLRQRMEVAVTQEVPLDLAIRAKAFTGQILASARSRLGRTECSGCESCRGRGSVAFRQEGGCVVSHPTRSVYT